MKPEVREELVSNIRRRLTPQAIKFRADLEITCFAYEGVNALKEAIKAGEATSPEDIPVKVKLVAPPLYVMITTALDKQLGVHALEAAITKIQEEISARGGQLQVKMLPKAVSETDDKELADLMARVERENAEVSGDEQSGSDVDGA